VGAFCVVVILALRQGDEGDGGGSGAAAKFGDIGLGGRECLERGDGGGGAMLDLGMLP